jgi:type IV pilus assembly protein PilA
MSLKIPQLFSTGFVIALLTLAACTKNAEAPAVAAPKPVAIDVVKETERSRSFLAVSKQLELGGPLYGYMDVDGDVQKLAGGLQAVLEQVGKTQPQIAPFAKQDYAALATMLGLTDVKAMGVSSVPDGDGYFRNRMFLYTGGERHGLLAGLGGKPGPFTHLNLAPADAGFYAESEMDLPVIYRSIKDVIAKVGGEPASSQFELALKKAGEAAALSVLDLIYGLKGHSAVVLRIDATKTLRLPGPPPGVTLPSFALLICVDGIAPVVETALAKSPMLKRTDTGTLHIYESAQPLPLEGIQPVLVADGSTLYVATSRAFLDECRTQKAGLAQSAEFQRSLAHVGSEGNGLSYVSPRLFEQLRQIEKLNPGLPAETKSMINFVLSRFPSPSQPLVTIRTNLPDGVLVRSYLNRSLKQDVVMISVYNPVTIGFLAAMAIPAFQKVRVASQDKAVLNNLRQLAAAADQFYLENGVTAATYNDLVGPTRYVKVLVAVAGEDYRALRFRQGQTLRVTLSDGRTVEYTP